MVGEVLKEGGDELGRALVELAAEEEGGVRVGSELRESSFALERRVVNGSGQERERGRTLLDKLDRVLERPRSDGDRQLVGKVAYPRHVLAAGIIDSNAKGLGWTEARERRLAIVVESNASQVPGLAETCTR